MVEENMIDLRLKLRDDEVKTMLEFIKMVATYYSAKSVTEITSGTQKGYMEAHEKKSYAWQLFDHIKHAVDSANERKELAEEIEKDNHTEIEDINDRLTNALTEFECLDYEYEAGKVFANEVAVVIDKLVGLLS